MREITDIIIHCSASRETSDYTLGQLTSDHKKRGFRTIGYHYYVRRDGTIEKGRDIAEIGAHVQGHNQSSIGICYEGGLDKNGMAKDTRTEEQKIALLSVIEYIFHLLKKYQPISDIKIKGHRDYSPDTNKNGKIERWEHMKECPCFDVQDEY